MDIIFWVQKLFVLFMTHRKGRNNRVAKTIVVFTVISYSLAIQLLLLVERRFTVIDLIERYTITLSRLFIRNWGVDAYSWGKTVCPSIIKSRHYSSSMTCRPIIPTTVSPITTKYRKRLLIAFAQTQLLNVDNDTSGRNKPMLDGNDDDENDNAGAVGTSMNTVINHDEEYKFLKQVSTLSSSPQRLCYVSAMTQCCSIQQIYELRDNYNTAAKQLHMIMSNPNLDGNTKHQMHCQHRYNYGRQPYVCKDCWSYLPICICHKQQHKEIPNVSISDKDHQSGDSIFQHVPRLHLPPLQQSNISKASNSFDTIDVIMWTHHKEWGSPSNTGSVLVVALRQLCRRDHSQSCNSSSVRGYMFMKGYDEHDGQFEQLLRPHNDTEIVIPVVLWAPAAEDDINKTSSSSVDNEGEVIDFLDDNCKIESNQDDQTVKAAKIRTPKRQFVSVDALLDDLHQIRTRSTNETTQKQTTIRLVMIAVEGTWNQAKRMVTKLPHQVRALHLSDIELFQWRTMLPSSLSCENAIHTNDEILTRQKQVLQIDDRGPIQIRGAVSILDPLRKQKTLNRYPSKKEKQQHTGVVNDNDSHNDVEETLGVSKVINTNKVCTVEAVVSALVALDAIPIPAGDYIINLADQKVIRTVTFQGKMTLRNIISHW